MSEPTRGARKPARPSAPKSSRAKKPAEELQPLDLEGTDFEGLLEASARPTARKTEPARPRAPKDSVDRARSAMQEAVDEAPIPSWSEQDAPPASTLGSIPAVTGGFDAPTFTSSAVDPAESLEDPARPRDELLAGLAGLVLAVSTLLPWYRLGARELTGLASGTFAALAFAVGLAAAGIVVLRRLGRPVRFPLEFGLVLEVLGYAGVGSVIVKRFLRPSGYDVVNLNTFLALGSAAGLAFMASKLSAGAPFVIRPGWAKESGGKVGAGLLAGIVLVAGVLAVVKPGAPTTPKIEELKTSSTAPACVEEANFPVLAVITDVTYRYGTIPGSEFTGEPYTICTGEGRSTELPPQLQKRFQTQLAAAKWKFETPKAISGIAMITLREPRCGFISMNKASGTSPGAKKAPTLVSWNFGTCRSLGGPN